MFIESSIHQHIVRERDLEKRVSNLSHEMRSLEEESVKVHVRVIFSFFL
jgi:hypothetical protein